MDMEPVAVCPRAKPCCSILCLVKATLFVLVTVFVLYLPMGDPNNYCNNANSAQNRKVAMCCLCDVYLLLVKIVNRVIEMAQVAFCVLMDLLYEAKLKFYSILEKIDRNDICRSVCCSDSSDLLDTKRGERRPPCRCSKKCSKNKLDRL